MLSLRTPGPDAPAESAFFTDPNRISQEESYRLQQFIREMGECRPNLGVHAEGPYLAPIRSIMGIWDEQQALYSNLQLGGITWGQFNLASRDNSRRLGDALALLREQAPILNPPPAAGVETSPAARTSANGSSRRSSASSAASSSASASSSSASGPYLLHLASYRDETNLRIGWNKLRAQAGESLEGMEPISRQLTFPSKGSYFRLYAGPVADLGTGNQLCRTLRSRGVSYCQVVPESQAGTP
jgi:hypothetical protein